MLLVDLFYSDLLVDITWTSTRLIIFPFYPILSCPGAAPKKPKKDKGKGENLALHASHKEGQKKISKKTEVGFASAVIDMFE